MDLFEKDKKLFEEGMKNVIGFCIFSGQPILKSELTDGPSGIQFFYQQIVIKYEGIKVSQNRRVVCVRTDELAKSAHRTQVLKDLLYIELDFGKVQDNLLQALQLREVEKEVRSEVDKRVKGKDNGGSKSDTNTIGAAGGPSAIVVPTSTGDAIRN